MAPIRARNGVEPSYEPGGASVLGSPDPVYWRSAL